MSTSTAANQNEYLSGLIEMRERREKATKMVAMGFSLETAARTFNIKVSYLKPEVKKRMEGKEATPIREFLGKLGQPPKIPADIAAEVQLIIRTTRPHDHGLASEFWSRSVLRDLLIKVYGIELDRRSIDSVYHRWGLDAGDAYKIDANTYRAEALEWIENTYPTDQGQVMRSNGAIRWVNIKDAPPIYSPQSSKSESQTPPAGFQITLYVKNFKYTYFTQQLDGTDLFETLARTNLSNKEWIYCVLINASSQAFHANSSYESDTGVSIKIGKAFGKCEINLAPMKPQQEPTNRTGFSTAELSFGNGRISSKCGVITISNKPTGFDEPEIGKLDLNECWLPATSFAHNPSRLSDHADLCEIVFACATESLMRSKWSKSSILTALSNSRSVIKLIEWCWLRGIASPFSLTQSDFNKLAIAIANGGWAEPLDISNRTIRYLSQHSPEETRRLASGFKSRKYNSLSRAFNAAIGTSLNHKELASARELVLEHIGASSAKKKRKKKKNSSAAATDSYKLFGESKLRQEFTALNLLAEIDESPLNFTPYPNTKKLSEQLGNKNGRTPNLTPTEVANLLGESLKFIHSAGPLLVDVLNEYVDRVFRRRTTPTKYNPKLNELQECQSFNMLEAAIGKKITSFTAVDSVEDPTFTSVAQIIYEVQFSAAIIIAFLNARRKDEIIGSKIGLFKGALQCIDNELNIFSAHFYIEKSFRDYVPYLVSDHTVSAIQLLEALNDIQHRWKAGRPDANSEVGRQVKLFSNPVPTPANRKRTSYFQLKCGPEDRGYHLIKRVLDEGTVSDFGLHMGRRAYALIFIYRYENAALMALAYQFGTLSIDRVRTYISDVLGQRGGARATDYGPVRTSEVVAKKADLNELENEVRIVSQERLTEIVTDILSTSPTRVGLFTRLVQRVHQKLMGSIDYQKMPPESQSIYISDLLKNKGHRVEPYPHGNCMASTTRSNWGAKCRVSGELAPHRENASIPACTKCMYHDYADLHHASTMEVLSGLKQQLDSLPADSIRAKELANSIADAESWLTFRSERISVNRKANVNNGEH